MRDDPPNPYRDASLRVLRDRAMEVAGQLLKGERPGRRDLAYLLIALGHRVAPDDAHPNSPHRVTAEAQAGFEDAFWPAYEDLRRQALYRILTQAVDASGEPPTAVNRYLPRFDVLDEMGLRAALIDLDARASARRASAQHKAEP